MPDHCHGSSPRRWEREAKALATALTRLLDSVTAWGSARFGSDVPGPIVFPRDVTAALIAAQDALEDEDHG
jgi:hypothetical protein